MSQTRGLGGGGGGLRVRMEVLSYLVRSLVVAKFRGAKCETVGRGPTPFLLPSVLVWEVLQVRRGGGR